jgi:hypothetical protein
MSDSTGRQARSTDHGCVFLSVLNDPFACIRCCAHQPKHSISSADSADCTTFASGFARWCFEGPRFRKSCRAVHCLSVEGASGVEAARHTCCKLPAGPVRPTGRHRDRIGKADSVHSTCSCDYCACQVLKTVCVLVGSPATHAQLASCTASDCNLRL